MKRDWVLFSGALVVLAALDAAIILAPAFSPIPRHEISSQASGEVKNKSGDDKGQPEKAPTVLCNPAYNQEGKADKKGDATQNTFVKIKELPKVAVSVERDQFDRSYWVFSGLLVVVGVLQVYLLWGTLGAIKIQIEDARKESKANSETTASTLAAMKTSADAVKISADISAGLSIPTLAIHRIVALPAHHSTIEKFLMCPNVEISIKNYGKTPAFLKWWTLRFACDELPKAPIYGGPFQWIVLDKLVVMPGDIFTVPGIDFPRRRFFSPDEIQPVIRHETQLSAYGFICYGDVFGNFWRFNFCETALNLVGGEQMCDWWGGMSPSAYSGIEPNPVDGDKNKGQPKNPN